MERGDNETRDLMSSVKFRRDSVRCVDEGESEAEELDRLARETREKGISWKSHKAELGL
ncbi:hypothetical protein [Methanothrix harundinacea]|uniref:Uncharacterized protein n=1 Tax=Methanothrix harundinacea (strain 6Ac) TaxID=1110509 RepID=G7WLT0_METH6|nr:hypothetical protein [Methanothrix harundinacea]AET63673.1 hypothetical protein Mhar_0285 [Methanothrix harundinacea 6Ac]